MGFVNIAKFDARIQNVQILAGCKIYSLFQVEELVLDGNYNLDRIELLSQGHSEHSEWNLPQGSKHSNFRLSQINSNLSERALAALRGSGRVLNPDALKRRLVKVRFLIVILGEMIDNRY